MIINENRFRNKGFIDFDDYIPLDGVNDYLKINSNPLIDFRGDTNFTISLFFRPSDFITVPNTGHVINDANSKLSLRLNVGSTSSVIRIFDNNSEILYHSFPRTSWLLDKWNFFHFVYDYENLTSYSYVNGVLRNQVAITEAGTPSYDEISGGTYSAPVDYYIGSDDSGGNNFEMDFGYIRFFNRALDLSEMEFEIRYIGFLKNTAAEKCVFEVSKSDYSFGQVTEFTTNWDADGAADGTFTTVLNTSGTYDPDWQSPDGNISIDTETLTITGATELDGTNKTIKLYLKDYSAVTSLSNSFLRDKKIVGTLDLKYFNNITSICSLGNNPDLTEIIFPENFATNYFFISNCGLTGDINLYYASTCRFSLHTQSGNVNYIFNKNVIVSSELSVYGLGSGSTFTFPNTFDISGIGLANFSNSSLPTSTVDKILIDLSSRTPPTGISTEISVITGNSARSSNSDVAVTILEDNGYIIT